MFVHVIIIIIIVTTLAALWLARDPLLIPMILCSFLYAFNIARDNRTEADFG